MTLKHTTKSRRFLNENHDNCTVCKRSFKNDETTHLGYTSDNVLVYTGDCCSRKIKQTIVRHVFRERVYQVPNKESKLWRFMDFTKYVSLLNTRSLFFSRADLFEDPFEGAKGIKKNKRKWDKHYLEFFESAYRNPPEGVDFNKSDREIKIEAKRLLLSLDEGRKRDKERTFISCWHENEFESEAMWKLYTTNMKEGIAITTTYDKLYRSLNKNPSISIGRVNYIDFENRFAGINDAFWYKRKAFEHEKEVRAIIKDFSSHDEFGKVIPVKLNTLVDKVFVSPTSQVWFKRLVEDVTIKYGMKRNINISRMNTEPFH